MNEDGVMTPCFSFFQVTQPQSLHYGLYNQGNTCYLNSVLQILCVTEDFHNRFEPAAFIWNNEKANQVF